MVRIDNEINVFKEEINAMSQRVRRMFVLALEVLDNGSKESALKIVELDEYVNNDNEEINDKGIEILSLLAPVASDLRIILAGIKIATDLERIGDYAKAIARFVIRNDQLDHQLQPYVKRLGDTFLSFFDATLTAYIQRDVKSALELPAQDDLIDDEFKKLILHIEKLTENNQPVTHLIPTIGMLRNIERAGDHTKNICEHLIYEVKGQHYDFG